MQVELRERDHDASFLERRPDRLVELRFEPPDLPRVIDPDRHLVDHRGVPELVHEHHGINRRKLIILWSILFIVANAIMISLLLVFPWIWIFFIPVNFLIIAAFQALSHEFIETQAPCPRCNALNNIHNLKCVNCGLSFESLGENQQTE